MKRTTMVAAASTIALALAACQGGGGAETPDSITMLIGSSGDVETSAVQAAADAWTEESGVDVEVIPASDLTQELAQGFAGDAAPDVFYMSWDQFQTYAADDYLEPYAGDLANASDFYPALVEQFSYDGEFVCAPKDFSTLGLVINTDLWEAAGLTADDIPTDWDELADVAGQLTSDGVVGLSMSAEYANVGVFLSQAGGGLMTSDAVTADSEANQQALEYLQGLLVDGSLAWPADLGAGWAGEAFGNGDAAMIVVGPWIQGAMASDFPDVQYRVEQLPAGPGGQGTFTFSNCWGIPEGSSTAETTQDLVAFLTSDDQQVAFSDAFGVIPSTESAAATYVENHPENEAFVVGAEYAESPIAFPGSAEVVSEFNNSLPTLADEDAAALLTTLQGQLEDAWAEAQG